MKPCFECGQPAQHDFAVLQGSSKTVPLCRKHFVAAGGQLPKPKATPKKVPAKKKKAKGKAKGRGARYRFSAEPLPLKQTPRLKRTREELLQAIEDRRAALDAKQERQRR